MTRKELEQHVRDVLANVHTTVEMRGPVPLPLDDMLAVYEDYLLLIQEGRELRARLDSADAKGER